MKSQKARSLILLAVNLAIVGGVYMFANRMHFFPIMWIYPAIVIISCCGYIYLHMKDEIENAKPSREGRSILSDEERRSAEKRKKLKKLWVLIFLPFLITILCDYTYLLILSDNHFFTAIMEMFK